MDALISKYEFLHGKEKFRLNNNNNNNNNNKETLGNYNLVKWRFMELKIVFFKNFLLK